MSAIDFHSNLRRESSEPPDFALSKLAVSPPVLPDKLAGYLNTQDDGEWPAPAWQTQSKAAVSQSRASSSAPAIPIAAATEDEAWGVPAWKTAQQQQGASDVAAVGGAGGAESVVGTDRAMDDDDAWGEPAWKLAAKKALAEQHHKQASGDAAGGSGPAANADAAHAPVCSYQYGVPFSCPCCTT